MEAAQPLEKYGAPWGNRTPRFSLESDGTTQTWLARWRDPKTGERYFRALGNLTDITHDAAIKAARIWWDQHEAGIHRVTTVEAACKDYVENHCKAGGDRNSHVRLLSRTHVTSKNIPSRRRKNR
jgi:hypothetical protein